MLWYSVRVASYLVASIWVTLARDGQSLCWRIKTYPSTIRKRTNPTPFSPRDSQGSGQSAEQGDYKRSINNDTLATKTLTTIILEKHWTSLERMINDQDRRHSPTGPRARATIVGVVAIPIILRLRRHLLVIFPLDALEACRPSDGCRDLLSFDGVARCKSSVRDTSSATDTCGPLDG
jgi:hypothetical protein